MPWLSAITWTSMWRPCSTYFSTSMVSSPNADARLAPRGRDRLVELASADGRSRMPLPPPPAAALTRTGIRLGVLTARHHGHAGGDGDLARGVLAAHLLHHRRPTGRPGRCRRRSSAARERRALGEEAVAGVHRLGAGVDARPRRPRRCRGSSRPAPPRRRRARAARSRRGRCRPRRWRCRAGRQVRITRSAISPRLAIRTLLEHRGPVWRRRDSHGRLRPCKRLRATRTSRTTRRPLVLHAITSGRRRRTAPGSGRGRPRRGPCRGRGGCRPGR